SVASTTTVKFRAYDDAGNAEPVNTRVIQITTVAPTVVLTSPSNGSTVKGTVTLSATVQGMTVDHVDFLVDGANAASTSSGPPYSVQWDSTSVADGSHMVVAHAVDTAGHATDSDPATITVSNAPPPPPDTTPPTSSISCNGGTCSNSFYGSAVSVTLAASDDSGGSGVAAIRYTTDGSDPTSSNGSVYGGSFSVASTTTVKFRAYDNAGNAEPVNTKLIQITTTPPTSE